jgi:phytoene desaturase
MKKRIAVVGGGMASLSGAIHLACKGFDVTLFEKNAILGGKMNQAKIGEFRFDMGPSLITMPFVIDELFHTIGQERASVIDFVPLEPLCRYHYADGTVFDSSANPEKMTENLAKVAPSDAAAWKKYLTYCERIYRLTADIFLFKPVHELMKIATWQGLRTLAQIGRIDPFRTVHQANAAYFSDARLVQLFDRYATYNGSNPFEAPATLNIIPYVEYAIGGYYIRGGIYKLAETFTAAAIKLGVHCHTLQQVEKIIHDGYRAKAVRVNGDDLPFDAVFVGTDVIVAFNHLIDGFPQYRKKLNSLEPSLSGMLFLWGIKGSFPQLTQHNIFFSQDYSSEFRKIFSEKCVPDDPTIYIAISSKNDANDAPLGHENWFVLVNMPYLNEGQDWEASKSTVRSKIEQKLSIHGIDIKGKIIHEKILTPLEFHDLYSSNRGSIYGISSNSRSMAFRRPPNRSRQLSGLYFAGGSVHPGGGVPLALLSGKIAAELIHEREVRDC